MTIKETGVSEKAEALAYVKDDELLDERMRLDEQLLGKILLALEQVFNEAYKHGGVEVLPKNENAFKKELEKAVRPFFKNIVFLPEISQGVLENIQKNGTKFIGPTVFRCQDATRHIYAHISLSNRKPTVFIRYFLS